MTGPLGAVDLPAPIGDRWCEDYVAGSVYEFGHASPERAGDCRLRPALRPAVVHTDPACSTTGPFDGLIASGVHTIAACMRLYVCLLYTSPSPRDS